MFNPEAFEYMNYQFGDRVDESYLYGGIYNNNILLIDIINIHYFGFDRPFPTRSTFRYSPTLNEIHYIYSKLYDLPRTKYFIPIMGLNIKELVTIDSLYYTPTEPKFMIFIKRIPIH